MSQTEYGFCLNGVASLEKPQFSSRTSAGPKPSVGMMIWCFLAVVMGSGVVFEVRAANSPWQTISAAEGEAGRQIGSNEQAIHRAEAKITQLLEQKARTLAELRSGMFCSECKRSASEIERASGQSFSKHLTDVKGKPIPASAALLAEKAAEYDRQIAQLREEVQRLREGIRDAQERARRAYEERERSRREEEARRQQEVARQQEAERRRKQDEDRRRREETAERTQNAMRGFQEQQSALTRSIQSSSLAIQEVFEGQRRAEERREEMRERQREAAREAEREERRRREEREDREAAQAAAEESARRSATAPVADTTAWQAQAQARRDEAERQRAQGEARQRAALAEREAERRRAWEAPAAPLAAIGSFRGNSRPPPAVDEDSLLGDVLENSLFSAVGQATSRRMPSPALSLQEGLFGTLTDRVENRAGEWIRSQRWFNGRSLNDAPADERDEREFLYSGTKALLNLLSRNVQGAVNAGRDAVDAGIGRPLQRFSEDDLFKP